MVESEGTLLILFAILFLGLVVPEFFRKLRLPFVTILILLGSILGPKGINFLEIDGTIKFFGFLGMSFLMLMAGIETDLSKFKKNRKMVFIMALFNGLIPFLVGFSLMALFGYGLLASFLVGIVFISSSVAIIVPTLKSLNLFKDDLGQLILSSVLLTDIVSLVALGFVFQNVKPVTNLPLGVYYVILIVSLFFLFKFLPWLSKYSLNKFSKNIHDERRLRFVIIVMVAVLLFFSLLGVHAILAAFLSGLVLSSLLHEKRNSMIYEKLHTLGYGLFIPVFFFIVGMEMDLGLLADFDLSNLLMISLILGLILAKTLSGFFAGKLVGLKNKDSLVFGSISMVQLTTTLAVTFTAYSLGLLDNVVITSIILISIITTIVGPILTSYIGKKN